MPALKSLVHPLVPLVWMLNQHCSNLVDSAGRSSSLLLHASLNVLYLPPSPQSVCIFNPRGVSFRTSGTLLVAPSGTLLVAPIGTLLVAPIGTSSVFASLLTYSLSCFSFRKKKSKGGRGGEGGRRRRMKRGKNRRREK